MPQHWEGCVLSFEAARISYILLARRGLASVCGSLTSPATLTTAIADPSSAKIGEPDMPLRMPLAASVITGPLLCCTLQPNHSHSPSRDSNWAEDSPRTSAIRSGVTFSTSAS